MEKLLKILWGAAVLALLAAVLWVQVRILNSLPKAPPTIGEIRMVKDPSQRNRLLMQRPLMVAAVEGDVTVSGEVEVIGSQDRFAEPVRVAIVRGGTPY